MGQWGWRFTMAMIMMRMAHIFRLPPLKLATTIISSPSYLSLSRSFYFPTSLHKKHHHKGAGAFHSAGQSKEGKFVLVLPSIRFSWNFIIISVWNGPKGPEGPKKDPKWSKTLRLTILVPFGPLWSVDKPAMFGHFWSKMDHFWAIPSHERWTPK